MKNKQVVILALVLVLLGGLFLATKKRSKLPSSKTQQTALELAHKNLRELTGEKEKSSFDGEIKKGQEVTLKFLMHDYSQVPKNAKSFQEIKEGLKPLEGQASFKVKEIGETTQVSALNKARQGKKFYYLIFEFKGDPSIPQNGLVHPQFLQETGWDPAPQFVAIINGKDHYSKSLYARSLLKSKGYNPPLGSTPLNSSEWTTQAAVWIVETKSKPTLALKYIAPDKSVHYLKVKE